MSPEMQALVDVVAKVKEKFAQLKQQTATAEADKAALVQATNELAALTQ